MEEKIFVCKVSFAKQNPIKNVHRTLEVKGSTSLYDFARAIVHAFGFQFDHAFGFHNNIKKWYESDEVYTSFGDDEGGSSVDGKEKSVKNNYVYKVFEPKKQMIFHFDYGDDWFWLVDCQRVTAAVGGKEYPHVTKIKGEPPKQYQVYSGSEEEQSEGEQQEENEGKIARDKIMQTF